MSVIIGSPDFAIRSKVDGSSVDNQLVNVAGDLLTFALMMTAAAALAWSGFQCFTDRSGSASRRAARWTAWRLDRPDDSQPRRRQQTFEQAVAVKRGVGLVMIALAVALAGIAVGGPLAHL